MKNIRNCIDDAIVEIEDLKGMPDYGQYIKNTVSKLEEALELLDEIESKSNDIKELAHFISATTY